MKKTITIHIKGIPFNIEEEAYESLQRYLERLEQKLGRTQGSQEILEDIELRIAEILSENIQNELNQVVQQIHIDEVIKMMGEPEDYIDESTHTNESERVQNAETVYDKKLFRDMENASIAGVCAGLSQYFKVDLILIRVLFVLILLFGGFALPLYIILWIVIPKAQSHVDRLKMRGKPINFETVRDEVEAAAKKMADQGEKWSRNLHRETQFQRGMNALARVMRAVLGIVLLFVGISSFIGFLTIIVFQLNTFPVSDEMGMYNLYEFTELFYGHAVELSWAWIVGGILASLIVLFFIITGLKLIFNMNIKGNKYITRTAIVSAILFVILSFYMGTRLASQYTFQGEEERMLTFQADDLSIKVGTIDTINQRQGYEVRTKKQRRLWMEEKNGRLHHPVNRFRFEASPDSAFHLWIYTSSQGKSQKIAFQNARNIQFSAHLKDNQLFLADAFSFPKQDLFRGQDVEVTLQIPDGKSVNINGQPLSLTPKTEEIPMQQKKKTVYIDWEGDIEIYD